MRKWLSVIQMLVALALVFAVIGCSSGASPVTEPPETGSEATDEAPVSQETEEVPTSQEAVEEAPTPDISDEQTEEP
ncbi:MAG: hypothetical protein LBT59_22465, partial [Clostridiales bacterium]|nr:hypothetical protein [Clostridiales bacterium]